MPSLPSARTGSPADDGTTEVSADIAVKRLVLVNVAFIGAPQAPWILVDAGVYGAGEAILAAADKRFAGRPPEAIVMTHGHFDHVGALAMLAEHWRVPVIAHKLELPFMNGTECYPPPDPTVGGGLMSLLSPLYPRGPIDAGPWLRALDEDAPGEGGIAELPGWRWLHTPGHTPGHISLWRPSDRTLIAGDAFITTRQESAYAVMLQTPEINGPPKYYTSDWVAAAASVRRLAALEPETVVTGHGPSMRGKDMRAALQAMAQDFEWAAIPDQGRYVPKPAGERAGQ